MDDLSDPSLWSWKHWLALAASVGSVIGGVYMLASGGSSSSSKKPSSGKRKSKKKQRAAEERKMAEEELPDDELFLQNLMASMDTLQQQGQGKGGGIGEREALILNWLSRIDVNDYSVKVRLIAAQWLVLYHTIKSISARTPEEFQRAIAGQTKDMSKAWELLNCEAEEEDEKQAVDLLKLDVAQRLKDHTKMSPVFDRVVAKGEQMCYEEVVVSFTTAPLLGRWQTMRDLGAKIIGEQGSLTEFHQAAMTRPDIPDYSVLYDLAEEEAKKGDADPDSLAWKVLKLAKLEIRLRDVVCEDDAKREQVQKAFDPEGKGEWKRIPTGPNSRLLRFGGIAQMLSLTSTPIPMVGPANDDSISVLGYAVMRSPNQASGPIRQTQSYTMKRTGGDEWEGDYVLLQERDGPGDFVLPKIVFDMKMTLVEDPNGQQ